MPEAVQRHTLRADPAHGALVRSGQGLRDRVRQPLVPAITAKSKDTIREHNRPLTALRFKVGSQQLPAHSDALAPDRQHPAGDIGAAHPQRFPAPKATEAQEQQHTQRLLLCSEDVSRELFRGQDRFLGCLVMHSGECVLVQQRAVIAGFTQHSERPHEGQPVNLGAARMGLQLVHDQPPAIDRGQLIKGSRADPGAREALNGSSVHLDRLGSQITGNNVQLEPKCDTLSYIHAITHHSIIDLGGMTMEPAYDFPTTTTSRRRSTTSRSSSSSSSTTVTPMPNSLQSIYEQTVNNYLERVGDLTPYQLMMFRAMCERMPPEAVEYCTNQTALAPRPSFRYWSAVANRIIAQGWRPDQESTKPKPAYGGHRIFREMDYEQREYEASKSLPPWMEKMLTKEDIAQRKAWEEEERKED